MILRGDSNATLKDLTMIAEDTVAQTRPSLVPKLCHMQPEEGAYTRVPVPANLPFPRAFEGERKGGGKLVNVNIEYDQQTYELTIDIDSDLARNVKAYSFESLVREASISAVIFPDYLLSNAVVAGSSTAGYDGVNFYGSTHLFAKAGNNTINNLISGTGTTVPQIFTDLSTGIAAVRGYKDNAGRLLNNVSAMGRDNFLIQCALGMEQNIRAVLNSETIPSVSTATSGDQTVGIASTSMTNTLRSSADYFPDGYLTGSSWYLHYIGMPQRPFVYFENYPIQVNVLGFGTEHEINTNSVRIALKHRFVLGYHRFDRSVKINQ